MKKLKLVIAALSIAAAPAWASSGIGKGVELRTTDVSAMCFVSLPWQALRHNSAPTKPCWSEQD